MEDFLSNLSSRSSGKLTEGGQGPQGSSLEMEPEEMLIVRNTFLELCKIADCSINPDRFISAPAIFGQAASSISPSDLEDAAPQISSPILNQTTVMVRNIPTRISATTFMKVVFADKADPSEVVDFLYLPIDFKTNKNLGYCFLNFKRPEEASQFLSKYDTRKYVFCETSEKKLQINWSNRQGFVKNLEVFTQTKMLDTWPSEFRPLALWEGSLRPIDSVLLGEILNHYSLG